MGKLSNLDKRVVAFVIPAALGIVAALATVSTDLLAYLEGPLPAVLLTAGLMLGVLAAAVVTLATRKEEPEPEPVPMPRQIGSGTGERLAMLARLQEIITDRLGEIDDRLESIEGAEDAVADARRAMDRLERFLFDVHGVSSMHDVEPELAELDPVDLIRNVIDRTSRVAGERTVKPEWPAIPEPVRADRKLMTLALANLIVNAVKFSAGHTAIVVRLAEHNDRVTFEVEDEGPGVPEGEDVWGELARGSNAEGVPGAGLGLALVRLIAEAHGGHASLRSTPTGTVASIEIPRP